MEHSTPFSTHRSHVQLCVLASMTMFATLIPGLFAADVVTESVSESPEGTIVAQGVHSVHREDLTISGLDGSFFVAPSSEKITIAGLTTPVVIERSGQVVGLVPVGMQWTYDDSSPLASVAFLQGLKRIPLQFFREHAVDVDPVLVQRFSDAQQRIVLLEELRSDPVAWLLASYHPDTLEYVWISDASESSDALSFLQATLLPFVDSGHPSVPSSLFVDMWARRLGQEIQLQNDREGFFTEYVHTLLPFLEQLADRGYVERSRWYRAALEELIPVYAPGFVLSFERQEAEDTKEVEEAETESVLEFSAEELEFRLRELLREAGGMFLTSTRLHAQLPYSIKAESIAFGSTTGDHIVSFTYNAALHEVSAVIRDGKTYPNAVTWEEFVQWMKR